MQYDILEIMLSGKVAPYLKKYWLPIGLCAVGLIFFGYGLIGLFGSSQGTSQDIVFEANSVSKNSEASPPTTKIQEIMVDVEGAVIASGVYRLPQGARVKDALIAAGGLAAFADKDFVVKSINLASKLMDGQKIYFPRVNESISNSAVSDGKSSLIDINSASKEELDSLPGIGPVTAEKIISLRPYLEISELLSKKAVTSRVFEQIKEKIAVN